MSPQDIAVIRKLIAHGGAQGWSHDITTATDDMSGEHRWHQAGRNRVSIWRGGLSVGYLDVTHVEATRAVQTLSDDELAELEDHVRPPLHFRRVRSAA